MLRLLDREDLEFIRLHGADAAHFRRQRYRTFLRFVTSLDREIERSLRQRLLHENWDMLEIAREKFWVRIRIWDLRLAAMLYLMGWSADLSLIQQHVVDLIRVSQPVSTPA